MKTIIFYFFLTFFSFDSIAQALSDANQMEVNQSLSDFIWQTKVTTWDAKTGESNVVELGQYKGKVIILDFWDIWCAGCIQSMPKLGRLKDQFKDKAIILSVTKSNVEKVSNFFKNKQRLIDANLNLVVGDLTLTTNFPYRTVPHVVWIDANGVYRGSSTDQDLDSITISTLIETNQLSLTYPKHDRLNVDYKKPLLFGDRGMGIPVLYNAAISGYVDGYQSRMGQYEDSVYYRLYAINLQLTSIYKRSIGNFHIPNSHLLFDEGTDKNLFTGCLKTGSEHKNLYCYELVVPKESKKKALEFMRSDLKRIFNHSATSEKRLVTCYVLKKKNDFLSPYQSTKIFAYNNFKDEESVDKFMENQSLDVLVDYLNRNFDTKIFLNETNIDYGIDLILNKNLSDIEGLKMALERNNLTLKEEVRAMNVLVIRPSINVE